MESSNRTFQLAARGAAGTSAAPERFPCLSGNLSDDDCEVADDAYMRTLHEWASNALALGDLDAEFNRVDMDGSGELEVRVQGRCS